MKLWALLFSFLLINSVTFAADDFRALENIYEHGSLPDFLPHVGRGLVGRCYMTKGSNQKIASVLMVSFEEDGFELAPFDALKKRVDFFDKMTYEDVLKRFPLIKKEFIWVSETADGAVLEKTVGSDEYRSEIRETDKYMIMRVFINGKIIKYCNYLK